MKNGNGLDALYEQEKALRLKIQQAKLDQQKQQAKDRKHLAEIIGSAVIDAEIPHEVLASIKQILASAVLDEKPKRLLQERGWL